MKNFIELYKEVNPLYEQKKYEEAFNLLTIEGPSHEIPKPVLNFYKFVMLEKFKQPEELLVYMNESLKDEDIWYPPFIRDFDSYNAIQSLPGFKEFYKTFEQRVHKFTKSIPKKVEVFEGNQKQNRKLIIVLDGNNPYKVRLLRDLDIQRYQTLLKDLDNKYDIALPESSRNGLGGFGYWYDPVEGAHEINEHINKLKSTYAIKDENIILMGFSAGARVILEGLLNNIFTYEKVCLFIPYFPDLERDKDKLILFKKKNIKPYIFSGDKDFCLPYAQGLSMILKTLDVDHRLVIKKDQIHWAPSDLGVYVKEALKFFKIEE